MRTLIETEAMLLRHEAAISLRGEEEGLTLLAMVVAPDEATLAASLAVAERDGPSPAAHWLHSRRFEPKPMPVSRRPARVVRTRPVRKRILTIDEILATA